LLIYGCDFSGAQNPTNKIYVTRAALVANRLHIEEIINCEERLDVYQAIVASKAPWGMDVPFSIPREYLKLNDKFGSWTRLLRYTTTNSRKSFRENFLREHSIRGNHAIFRATDRQVNGKSPISNTPIDMIGMIYGGFKLLDCLVTGGQTSIYPFMPLVSTGSRLYEVYPKHTWDLLNLKNLNSSHALIPECFQKKIDNNFEITYSTQLNFSSITKDGMDSLVACITLAYCIYQSDIDSDWNKAPGFASNEEWDTRYDEGLVVRL
jgi:hypothetical protein